MPNLKPRIVATIEARMTSSRLAGKVLMPAAGKSMLEILIARLRKASSLDGIVVATTDNRTDDPIAELARELGAGCFRGSEEDVLDRVLSAAKTYRADVIVEITGDCPLVDPEIVEQVIALYFRSGSDYASNIEPVSYPIGMDTQVFSVKMLEIASKEGVTSADREHVSWYLRRNPQRFKQVNLDAPEELRWPELGLTLDEKNDYLLLRNIVEHFSPDLYFSCAEILSYLRAHPDLCDLNRTVYRKGIE